MLPRRRSMRAFLGVVAFVSLTTAEAYNFTLERDMKVVHTDVLFRHGQRSRLEKTLASEFGVNEGVALTPDGEKECYELGHNLRDRYVLEDVSNNRTTIDGIREFYSDRIQIVSSGYDRTLESAAALALGLYPPNADDDESESVLPNKHTIIPIHSSDPENDPVILAATHCPAYDDAWQEVYRTDEFMSKEDEAAPFIDDVYNEFEDYKGANREVVECTTEAEDFKKNGLQYHAPYNLWDCVIEEVSNGVKDGLNAIKAAPVPATATSSDGWEYLEELVFWIEKKKYEPSIAGRMVGGLFIKHMNDRFLEVKEHVENASPTVGRPLGMHITAGHYPTLKGVAAALDMGGLDGIPPTSSHLAFELIHNPTPDVENDEENFGVRILYQQGNDTSTLTALDLGLIYNADSEYDLDSGIDYNNREGDIFWWEKWIFLLDHLVEGGPSYYDGGETEWCHDCQNQQVDTCVLLALEDMTRSWEIAVSNTQDCHDEKDDVDDGVEGYHLALMSFFGILFGIAVGICVQPYLARRNMRLKQSDSTVSGNTGLEGWGTRQGTRGVSGVFRLGARSRTPTRHVMVGGRSALAVHTAADYDDGMDGDDGDAEIGDSSRIPAFTATSPLGTPVPFPRGEAAIAGAVKTAPSPTGDEGLGGFSNGISPTNGNGDFSGADSHGTQVDWDAEEEDDDDHWERSETKMAPLA